jgi:sugar lactone lactonase YvrE
MADTTILLEGLHFSEGPRWHDGRLFFSDFFDHKVRAVALDGTVTDIVDVAGQPSGIGWLPDGRMLVVSMIDQKVLRLEPDGSLVEHADVSSTAEFWANDMLVDRYGRAYVGNFGFDLDRLVEEEGYGAILNDPDSLATNVALVRPDGTVSVAADKMLFPNGTVLTADGHTLIVAETIALRLSAFDVAHDGTLSNRRVWADLGAELISPDGIAIDGDDAVWVANAIGPEVVRVAEGGEVLARVSTSQNAFACAIGGPDGTTLFACTAPTSTAARVAHLRDGRIEIATLEVAAISS